METEEWFKLKKYPHIGLPLTISDYGWIHRFVNNKQLVSKHSFLPFIHKCIVSRKYRANKQYDQKNPSGKRKRFVGQSAELPAGEYTDANDGSAASPMRNDVTPATWVHPISDVDGEALNIDEAGGEFIYVDNTGNALARTPGQGDTALIGTGAPLGAKFFEVGVGKVGWVDVDDTRIIYQNSTYGVNAIQLKYAVDTTLPILPVRETNLGLGEGYVIYHTTGVTNGIVIAYLDENDTTLNECAQ